MVAYGINIGREEFIVESSLIDSEASITVLLFAEGGPSRSGLDVFISDECTGGALDDVGGAIRFVVDISRIGNGCAVDLWPGALVHVFVTSPVDIDAPLEHEWFDMLGKCSTGAM